MAIVASFDWRYCASKPGFGVPPSTLLLSFVTLTSAPSTAWPAMLLGTASRPTASAVSSMRRRPLSRLNMTTPFLSDSRRSWPTLCGARETERGTALRLDRQALRPVEPQRRRGRLVLRRGGLARGPGPIIELGVGTGRIAVPVAAAGRRHRRGLFRGDARDLPRAGGMAGVDGLLDLRLGDYSSPPVAGPVALVMCPFRRISISTGTRSGWARCARPATSSRPEADSCSTSSRRAPRTSKRRTDGGSSGAGHLRARRLGHATPRPHVVVARPGRRNDDGAGLGVAGRVAGPKLRALG